MSGIIGTHFKFDSSLTINDSDEFVWAFADVSERMTRKSGTLIYKHVLTSMSYLRKTRDYSLVENNQKVLFLLLDEE